MGWLRRLRGTFGSSRVDDTFDEETRFHFDQLVDEYTARGLTLEEAVRAARRRLGNLPLARDRTRDADTLRWLADFVLDVRYASRTLRRNPGFTAAALVTLSLGIGAATIVFSVVHGVLLRPLPYPSAERLVRVWEEHPGGAGAILGNRWISNRTYYAWLARHSHTIDVLGGFFEVERTIRVHDDDVRVSGANVSPSVLAAVGATPLFGRILNSDDAEERAEPVVLVSEYFWRHLLSESADVVGRRVSIDGRPHTIVGVTRAEFAFPDRRARFWTPYVVPRVPNDPALRLRTSGAGAVARLAPGVTAAQAEAEGTAVARSVPVTESTQALFGKGGPPIVRTMPLVTDMTGEVKPALLVLMAAVACLLLIACVNVGNLCLSRGVARQREMAVRAAIGAGRGRLVRQLLTESVIVSAGGGMLGVAASWMTIRVLPALIPAGYPRVDDVRLDARVLAFAALAAFVTLLVSGVIPAWRGTRHGLAESLHGGDGAAAGGFRGASARHLGRTLLVAEAAFAVMLLVGACLMARSFVRLMQVEPGYVTSGVLTARVLMPQGTPAERTTAFVDTVLTRTRAIPGVVAAGAGNMMPMLNITAVTTFTLPADDPSTSGPATVRAAIYSITPGYAEALGLRLRQGRLLDARDADSAAPRALVVNDEFVRRYLTGTKTKQSPVGYRFTAGLLLDEAPILTEIVGVVGNVLKDGHDRQPQPEIYFSHASRGRRIERAVNLVIRTSNDAAMSTSVMPAVRQILRETDRGASIERIAPLADQVSASVARPRFAAVVLGTFAVVALILASVGLYGVLSYSVSQRRREFGVRAALGASRRRLVMLVLREGLTLTATGIALGLAGAAALTRLMQSALFGVTPLDPTSFALAASLLLAVALAACLIPSARAASVDPAEAFRSA
jgi:putative ABC transport system permease protein